MSLHYLNLLFSLDPGRDLHRVLLELVAHPSVNPLARLDNLEDGQGSLEISGGHEVGEQVQQLEGEGPG